MLVMCLNLNDYLWGSLSTLGYPAGEIDEYGRCLYVNAQGILGLTQPINGEPASHGNGMTIGFRVDSPELVDAWHAAGVANGGTSCEEPPGLRERLGRKLYLAYLRDPAGNKICATHLIAN
ncbi:VOC family protein [Pseudoalteromonas sp. S16_S37]|nr:VOC family protein [Pseudoalteromonas sp. S16_S37]